MSRRLDFDGFRRKCSRYIVPVVYLCCVLVTVSTIRKSFPHHGFLDYLLSVVFLADFLVWCKLKKRIDFSPGKYRVPMTLFYLLPVFLWMIFVIVASVLSLDNWTPFFRTYLLGATVIFFGVHLFLGIMYMLTYLFQRMGGWFGKWNRKHPHLLSVASSAVFGLFVFYGTLVSTFQLYKERIDIRQLSEETSPVIRIPQGLKGYTIVQISDFHIGSFVLDKHVRNIVEAVNEENPDMVVFTGDMVNLTSSEVKPYLSLLSGVQAKDGVYAILGNHDYGNYVHWDNPREQEENMESLLADYRQIGWRCLLNESLLIRRGDDTIRLMGAENWGKSDRFPKRLDMSRMYACTDSLIIPNTHPYTILLAHDPNCFDSIVYGNYPDISLTLSGHTHGMQTGVKIGGKVYSLSKLLYDHYASAYKMPNGQILYVNVGCGFNGLPFRIGMPPTISVLKL